MFGDFDSVSTVRTGRLKNADRAETAIRSVIPGWVVCRNAENTLG